MEENNNDEIDEVYDEDFDEYEDDFETFEVRIFSISRKRWKLARIWFWHRNLRALIGQPH